MRSVLIDFFFLAVLDDFSTVLQFLIDSDAHLDILVMYCVNQGSPSW